MFDIGALELLVLVVVAIIVIGPKDMPAALRVAGRWVGKMRRASAQFRSGFDNIVREAEMEDMETKWKEQNARIMSETPDGEMGPLPTDSAPAASAEAKAASVDPKAAPSSDNTPKDKAAAPPKKTPPPSKQRKASANKASPIKASPIKAAPKSDEPMLPLGKSGEK